MIPIKEKKICFRRTTNKSVCYDYIREKDFKKHVLQYKNVVYFNSNESNRNDRRYSYYFLMCFHGSSLTKEKIFLKTNIFSNGIFDSIENIDFFTEHMKDLMLDTEEDTIEKQIKWMANNPFVSFSKKEHSNYYLPPLFFDATKKDEDRPSKHMLGLWMIDYTTQIPSCKKIYSLNDLLLYKEKLKVDIFTYQNIHDIIENLMEDKNISGRIGMGIFCCRSYEKYVKNSNLSFREPFLLTDEKILKMNEITPTMKFEPLLFEPPFKWNVDVFEQSKFIKKLSNKRNFGLKLNDQNRQGCSLNVLHFYDIVNKNYAINKFLCTSEKDFSIYRTLEHIIQKYVEMNDKRFLIVRRSIHQLKKIINKISDEHRYKSIILKFYEHSYDDGNVNHEGHTLSLYVSYDPVQNKNVIMIIDPHYNIFWQFTPEYLFTMYVPIYRYFDIIYVEMETTETLVNSDRTESLRSEHVFENVVSSSVKKTKKRKRSSPQKSNSSKKTEKSSRKSKRHASSHTHKKNKKI